MLQPRRSLRLLLSASQRARHAHRRPPNPRSFTQNYPLLLLTRSAIRPQLPFLHSTNFIPSPRNQFQAQIARLLTTETRRGLRDVVKIAVKGTVYFWLIIGLLAISKFGIDNEILERAHPTPDSWSFWSRMKLRFALGEEDDEQDGSGLVDWAKAGNNHRQLIARLENPAIDGAGLRPPLGEGEEIYVEGIGKTGLDISMQTEPWRRGYYQALMGAARAAEHLDTWVRDTTRNLAFPPDVVIGMSNPRPKPVPFGAAKPPKEEDCEPAFERPQIYYMKLLTTQGFTNRQRLDAALAYADWLRFEGLGEAAAEMHSWAMDIAVGGLPDSTSLGKLVDRSTGAIGEDLPSALATSNLLLASTAFATHHAVVGNLATALPVFLSILRTQQSLSTPVMASPEDASLAITTNSALDLLKALFTPPEYPPPPPTGDEPVTRTPANICATAATMSHVGEILYAADLETATARPSTPNSGHLFQGIVSRFSPSSTLGPKSPSASMIGPTASQSAGLSWTRRAVDLAESILLSLDEGSSVRLEGDPRLERAIDEKPSGEQPRKRCAECLHMAIGNWVKMVERFETAQRIEMRREEKELRSPKRQKGTAEKLAPTHDVDSKAAESSNGWFWQGGKAPMLGKEQDRNGIQQGTWEVEAKSVRARAKEIRALIRQEGLDL